ncbi:lasso peptide biosynthesis B2 protein [Roseateles sp. BYS78W]|uniref:Lasso peptide biosynthesis B2 protein n=1 Tax=Pelomonas candidula TaxID=3299025 RepID=A0ABW7HJJ3_9BURK
MIPAKLKGNDVSPNAVQPATYRLADHVRACRIDGQVILLDLRRNKYQGVGGTGAASVSDVVIDWPGGDIQSPRQSSSDHAASVKALVSMLSSNAMLTRADRAPPVRQQLSEPLESWHPSDTAALPSRNWRDVLRLGLSAATTAYWLRRHSLAQIASNVMRLRGRAHGSVVSGVGALEREVSAYMRVRPFVLTARDQCLHDSLTLIRFLAARALFPSWVIGVRTRPFAAHSWVQSGNTVLNDLHENVRAFHPILVV